MPSLNYMRQRNLQVKNGNKKGSSTNLRAAKKLPIKKRTKSTDEYDDGLAGSSASSRGITFPGSAAAFRALVSARFCAAIWCHITDCDEVFNYWEPIHYLIYGWGLQTWEYSAGAALRSYAALWFVGAPGAAAAAFAAPAPPALLYLTRCLLAGASATSDLFFYKAVCQEFGVNVGRIWLAFSLTSGGSFIAGAAMLPSAWCGTLSSLALAAWWKHNYPLAIVFTALSTFIGWPFAGLLGVPIAIDLIFRRKKILLFAQWCSICITFILGPMVYIDSTHYGQLVIAPLNLVKYNVFTDHGPDLYGTEPWTYYLINGFLNFNIVWILALLCPLVLWFYNDILQDKSRSSNSLPYYLSLMPLYSWLAVFMLQPHKEERFLFPVYSMICLAGAVCVDCIQKVTFKLLPIFEHALENIRYLKKRISMTRDRRPQGNNYIYETRIVMILVMVIASVLGVSRSIGLYRHYHAPMDILRGLAEEEVSTPGNIFVCYGKEWHRFPSSFLFPDHRYRIGFVKSSFDGMLPAYYSSAENATMLTPDHFNDMNREQPRLYMNVTDCHYFVDSTIGDVSELEPRYVDDIKNWSLVKSMPFLDAAKSNRLLRAFYIPILSEYHVTYGEIQLLRSNKLKVV